MIVSILSVENLTQELETLIYRYSNDLTLAALLSDTRIEGNEQYFQYENVPEFMLTDNWKQPTEEAN
tara:strand:+ start:388 stop:588 length:201 start_codon:yes stop_codon:yes gene_type:complete